MAERYAVFGGGQCTGHDKYRVEVCNVVESLATSIRIASDYVHGLLLIPCVDTKGSFFAKLAFCRL